MVFGTKNWIFGMYLLLMPFLGWAQSSRPDCFSCNIQVKSLRKPIELRGSWLFTREDRPENKRPESKTDDWVTVEAPGPWSKAYRDGEYFEVGWYRGNFNFAPKLIGKKSVFYIDAYMSTLQIFLDGELLMKREGRHTHERFRSIQPIPVVFTITKPQHVITVRIDTRIMVGVYQLPFQLRPYKDFDPVITFYEFYGGEVRNIAAYIMLMFGLFFLLVYSKTRYSLYLVAGLTGIGIFPFYAFPHDNLIRLIAVEKLWLLHYIGISCMALGHVTYCQYFYKAYPKINKANYTVVILLAIVFIVMTVNFNMNLFQIVRKLTFLYSLWMATHMIWILYHGIKNDDRIKLLLAGELFFWVCSSHDILLALGIIKSTSLIFIGTLVATSSVLYTTTIIFAETFRQNRKLLKSVADINQNLEKTVAIRTHDLYEKTQNLSLILQSLPEGIMTIDSRFLVLPEYSQCLKLILETSDIAGIDVFQLLFADSNVSADVVEQMRSSLDFSFGESDLNFDANRNLLVNEYQTTIRLSRKILALGWSAILDESGAVAKILLTVSDVTHLKRLEKESHLLKLRSKIVETLMDGSIDRIRDFVAAARAGLAPFIQQLEGQNITKEQLATLYREIHTIKGNARTFDLVDLAESAHHVESELAELGRRSEKIEGSQVQMIIAELLESLVVIEEVKSSLLMKLRQGQKQEPEGVPAKLWLRFQNRWKQKGSESTTADLSELQSDIELMNYRQAVPYFRGLAESFNTVAEKLGKAVPTIHIDIPDDLFMDPNLAKSTSDILMHMIRNSLDHGFESTEDRLHLQKTIAGQVNIRIRPQPQGFVLDYSDDGRGLDLRRIRERALKHNFPEGKTERIDLLVQSIFRHGFSTMEKISEISGRGVGMEVVAQEMKRWQARMRWNKIEWVDPEAQLLPFDISILFPQGSIQVDESADQLPLAL